MGRQLIWTPDRIIEMLQTIHREMGVIPKSQDARYGEYDCLAHLVEGLPASVRNLASAAAYQFGSWRAAIAAAGFEPRPVGRPITTGRSVGQNRPSQRRVRLY